MDRYEEALERAKAGKPLDEVFPELKESESEDERVRKEIVKFVATVKDIAKSGRNSWAVRKEDVEMCERFLTYLEKQKDERELSFIEGKMEGVRQTCQEIKDAMSLFEPKDLTPFEFTFRDYIDSAIRYCLAGEGYQQYIKEWAADLLNLEMQKEQKPAEWNDTDMKEARNNLISVCRDWEFGKKTTLLPVAAVHARYFLEHLTEPKPAEWSEEDEKMLKKLIAFFHSISNVNVSDINTYISWLLEKVQSLRPQQKQEVVDRNVFYRIADILRWCDLPIGCPVENFKQSESEREHLLEIVQCVAHRYANSCTYCKEYSRGYQDGLAVHHWKPSEEQMIALEYFIRSWGESGTMSPQNPTLCAAKSLYNDLKKIIAYETSVLGNT